MTPTREYRRTAIETPVKLTKGLDAFVNSWVGNYQRRHTVTVKLLWEAGQADRLADRYRNLSDHHLREELNLFRDLVRRKHGRIGQIMQHALAVLREAAERKVGLRPYIVQMAGTLALHRGFLAEMATGEGKTLTAGIAGVLAGWTGFPCHIITVNDYLAERDAEWMKPLYRFCGLTVGSVTGALDAPARRKGYDCDVTYCTSKEIVADFLRDRLRLGKMQHPTRRLLLHLLRPHTAERPDVVMRGLHTAIVDEADCILIDEAVTPVIISAQYPNPVLKDACLVAEGIADALESGIDYRVMPRYREVELTDAGTAKIETLCGELPGVWKGPDRRGELVRQALTARELFHEGKQYVVQEGKVVIVDEFTGRMMPQRSWREGLHQAVEAKSGLEVSDPSETLARLSFQRFFRFFKRLSGMTGTAHEASAELWHVYKLPVIQIPTNEPCIREERPDRVFADPDAKWDAVVRGIADVHAQGRPVLVGTRNIAISELLSARLAELGLQHQVLNAVHHKEEAQIVAAAGLAGHITIATNMAGRGTDIKLARGVAEKGGLHVMTTERHESGRIDRQLYGRCARQGDPGSSQAFVSAEDELLIRYVPAALSKQLGAALRRRLPVAERLSSSVFAYAQWNAQHIAARQRRSVLSTDTWMDDSLSFAGVEYV